MKLLIPVLGLITSTQAFTSDYFYGICNAIVVSNPALDICTNGTRTLAGLTDHQHTCLYDNDDYLKSIYSCVAKAGLLSKVENAAKQSWHALDMASRNYTGRPVEYTFEAMSIMLEQDPVTTTFDKAAQDNQGAFYCPDSMLTKKVVKAGLAYNTNIYASNIYGAATVGFIGGIILLQTLLNLFKHLAPACFQQFNNGAFARKFRKHVAIPASFGCKRAVPIQVPLKVANWDLSFPPRLHSLLIAAYTILSLVLMFIRYDFVTTEFSYPTQIEAITKLIGYRSGYFAMYKLPVLVLFASKSNILMWATGWGYDIFNHWHRALGRLFLLDVVIHAACYSKWGQWAGVYMMKWHSFAPWIAAQTATLAAGLMCLLGNRTIRSKMYDVFRATHIILAVIVMVCVYIHISYFQLALIPFYVTIIFWVFERVVRLMKVMWSGIYAHADITEEGDEVLKINLNHSNRWLPGGGTYVFVHFLKGFECLNPHPFTVVKGTKQSRAQLYVKARTGRTKQILDMVRDNNGSMTIPVWIEGPYGHDFDKKHFREVVFVAGGVGITGVFSHLESACRSSSFQNFYVYWTVPNTNWLETFSELIAQMEQDSRVLLTIYVTRGCPEVTEEKKLAGDEIVSYGRPNLPEITNSHIEDSIGPTCFFVCGPGLMCDIVRKEVAGNLTKTRNYVEFNEECFAM